MKRGTQGASIHGHGSHLIELIRPHDASTHHLPPAEAEAEAEAEAWLAAGPPAGSGQPTGFTWGKRIDASWHWSIPKHRSLLTQILRVVVCGESGCKRIEWEETEGCEGWPLHTKPAEQIEYWTEGLKTHRPAGEPHSCVCGGHGAGPPALQRQSPSPPASEQPPGHRTRGAAVILSTLTGTQTRSRFCWQHLVRHFGTTSAFSTRAPLPLPSAVASETILCSTAPATASIGVPRPRSKCGSPRRYRASSVDPDLPGSASRTILSQTSFQGFSGAQMVPSAVQPSGHVGEKVGKHLVSTFSVQQPPSVCWVPGGQLTWGWEQLRVGREVMRR